jgi:tetratricopeptide (TPR) repeat protein
MTESDRALAPLNAVSAAIDKLETYRTPQELAESLQAIGQAVERALRQLLRADTSAPDELRLAALSPTDLPMDRLIPALRKHEIISIELAGMLHELQQAVVRASTNDVRAADADDARATIRRLNDDIIARADRPVRTAPTPASPPSRGSAAGAPSPYAPSPYAPGANPPSPYAPRDKSADAADASMRAAATSAVIRGDIEEDAHTVSSSSSSRGRRAILPIALLVIVALIIWGVMHFTMGSASPMKTGITAFEQQRWGVAEQNFRAVLKDHPDDVTAGLYLGRVLRVEGRPKDAAVVLNNARKAAPNDADVLRELGGALMDLNQPAAAVTALKQARELDPSNSATWVALIRALRAAGDPSAETELQRAPADAQSKLRSQP